MTKSGLLLVNKPAGFTSHDIVAKARKIIGTKKIGHAGTLDPMATGLLVLGVDAGTKLLTFIVGQDKTYLATIRLGTTTVTDDIEGEIIKQAPPELLQQITDELIHLGIMKLTGDIEQTPSSVSAIKVSGRRAYDLVRAGEEVELTARRVKVSSFEVIGEIRRRLDCIEFDVAIDCSSGTYIRALARDLGNSLQVGGHLSSLERTRVGSFNLAKAAELELLDVNQIINLKDAANQVLPLIEITEHQVIDIRNGKRIEVTLTGITGLVHGSSLVAIAKPSAEKQAKSLVVFSEVGDD